MKKILSIVAILFAVAVTIQAQSVSNLLNNIPSLSGTTVTVQGQTYLLTASTNSAGTATNYTATTTGPGGTTSVTVPTSFSDAIDQMRAYVGENNPTNAYFFGTNEFEIRLGGAYEQNSGQAAALISVTKWGLPFIPASWPVGAELGLLQGNQNGESGTAAAYFALDYRYIIGDTAAYAGLGGGYDNYESTGFLLVKAGVEHRFSPTVGGFVDLNYAFEGVGSPSRGFGFASGVTYSFASIKTLIP